MPERHDIILSKLVLDILKPHAPPLIEFARELAMLKGLQRVDASIMEVDADTDTVKLVVEGTNINVAQLEESIRKMGAALHSVDQVVAERVAKPKTD